MGIAAISTGVICDDAQYISVYVNSLVQGFSTPRQPQQLLPGADALGEHNHSLAAAEKPEMTSEPVMFLRPS